MDRDLVAIGGFVLLFVLMALRVPIGVAMGAVGVAGYALLTDTGPALGLLMHSPLRTVTDYNFSIIPMFVLMGVFASSAGMSRELFRASIAWLGHLPGGLAVATIFACGGFAAINGSSVATAAAMTTLALPEMRGAGYRPSIAAGVIASGGTLGIMIPPSGVMVIYGLLTDQDISQLFIAGILPGLLAIALYVVTVQIIAWRRADWLPRGRRHSWPERWESLRGIWATMLLFAFVIGGMYGGLFTVTEAAGMGAVGALIIGVLRGQLNGARIMTSLIEALRITAAIFTIAVGAFLFGYFLTITQTTQNLTSLLLGLDFGRYGVLAIILFAYLILGAIMDELAMILLTVPIVFPVIIGLGFDPIWFGVIIVMVVTLGMICPPVGINCFVINSIARDLSLVSIYRGVSPFILTDIIRLAILCAVPWISLVLPNTMK